MLASAGLHTFSQLTCLLSGKQPGTSPNALCQIRLIQLSIEIGQEKMNLGIAGAEIRQSQGSFSFDCGILEISPVIQALCQFIMRIAGLGICLNGASIFFNTVLGPAQSKQEPSVCNQNRRAFRRFLLGEILCLLVELQCFALISQSFLGHRKIEHGQGTFGRERLGRLKR